jgi:hypothetical protein
MSSGPSVSRPIQDDARDLGVTQGNVGAVAPAERTDGGEASVERLAGVDRRAPATERVRLLHLGQPIRSAAHREVDVAIDQARQQRGIRRIDAGCVRGTPRLSRAHLDNALVFDANPGILQYGIAVSRGEDLPGVYQ